MRNLNNIPLASLRVVEAVARHGTLARAALELGVTSGALSQRLTKAETALGQSLFIRTSTGLKPNRTCAEIAPRLTRVMAELSSILSDIDATQGTTLTVSVAPIFASRWLIWRINKFNQANPGIGLRVFPTVQVIDLDRSDVDIGIRVGSDPALGAGAAKLLDQRVFPVCSAGIADQISRPEDLLKFPVIRENDDLYGWRNWLSDHHLEMPRFPPGPTYADASLCLDAAMTGQGVFMAWETLASDALERGQIISPFRHRSLTGATYWLATSQYSARKPGVRKFAKWLEAELKCSQTFWNSPAG